MLRSVNESVCDEGQDRTTEISANDAQGRTKGNILLQQKGGFSRGEPKLENVETDGRTDGQTDKQTPCKGFLNKKNLCSKLAHEV